MVHPRTESEVVFIRGDDRGDRYTTPMVGDGRVRSPLKE